MSAPEVEYFAGNHNRDAVRWNSANILDHNRTNTEEPGDFMPPATWLDDEGRLCELSSEIVVNTHFFRARSLNKIYGTTRYSFTRTEPDEGSTFTFIVDSKKDRIEQLDGNGNPLQIRKRMAEAALLRSILASFNDYGYPEDILIAYNDELQGIDEQNEFNEIVYHFNDDARVGRLRRIGQRIRSLVGNS